MNIIQVYELFPTRDDCLRHIERIRWKGGPTCPYCGSTNATRTKKRPRYHCNSCNTSYSVTVRTPFHHTHLSLQKWFLAISLILNAKEGISSRQLSRRLEVDKDTAWRVSRKVREAMSQSVHRHLLIGLLEMGGAAIGSKRSED